MKLDIYKPSTMLAPYVHYYWVLEAENCGCLDSTTHRVIPNGLVELLINYGDDFVCGPEKELQPRVSLCGQKKNFFDIEQLSRTRLISVLFKPVGIKVFLPFALSEIVNTSIELDALFPGQSDRLLDQIIAAQTSREKITIVETFLARRLNHSPLRDWALMNGIIGMITRMQGQLKVDQLCHAFDLNARYLERKFSHYTGLTPKMFLRIVRFQHVLHAYATHREDLTTLGYNCGYYDQAHFIKEIKTFTGMPPSEFFSLGYVYSDYFAS